MGVLFVVSFGDNRFCNLSRSHHESRTWPLSATLPRVRNKNWICFSKAATNGLFLIMMYLFILSLTDLAS